MSGEKRVVSFSVWGVDPMYRRGAISNLVLSQRFYPGWEYRFYLDPRGGDATRRLSNEISERGGVAVLGTPSGAPKRIGLYWRLEALLDTSVDRVVFRDTDSRPSARETACVQEWIASGLPVHVMRDHRSHTAPLMGGMWGCEPKRLKRLVKGLRASLNIRMAYCLAAPWSESKQAVGHLPFSDQQWLAEEVWPFVKDKTFIHDESTAQFRGGHPFKIPRKSPMNFVGQAYSAQGVAQWPV